MPKVAVQVALRVVLECASGCEKEHFFAKVAVQLVGLRIKAITPDLEVDLEVEVFKVKLMRARHFRLYVVFNIIINLRLNYPTISFRLRLRLRLGLRPRLPLDIRARSQVSEHGLYILE